MTKRQLHLVLCLLAGFAGYALAFTIGESRPMNPDKMKQKISECEARGLGIDVIYQNSPNDDVIKDIQCYPPGIPKG